MDSLEIVPDDIPDHELRQEVNYRTHKAGYTTREGKPIPPKIMAVVPLGRRKLNVWPRDENGKLID